MRSKLKRINRGVVLTIIVAVVFIIVTIISNASFKNRESEEIGNVIKSYTEQLAQCSVNADNDDDFAAHSSSEARKIITGCWEESEYLESYNSNIFADTYYFLKSDMMYDLDYAEECFNSVGHVSSVTCTVSVGKIRKVSAYGAEADVSVTYKVYGSGNSGIYSLGGVYNTYELSEDTPATYNADNVTVELYKIDGQWKIVGLDWWGLRSDDMYDYY